MALTEQPAKSAALASNMKRVGRIIWRLLLCRSGFIAPIPVARYDLDHS
jgi:hypothetical protein